jgi:hypothetical protein
MDRVGGKKIVYDYEDSRDNLRELSLNFRQFSKAKTEFINKEHRQRKKITDTGQFKLVTANKTGANFMPTGEVLNTGRTDPVSSLDDGIEEESLNIE